MYDDLVKELQNMFRAYKATDNGNCRHAKTILQAADAIEELSKRTVKGNCKRCARSSTVLNNNTTRCPLEEHYALPDDGYCHLYEPPKEK